VKSRGERERKENREREKREQREMEIEEMYLGLGFYVGGVVEGEVELLGVHH
jgi:hypothetical protein